MNYINDMPEEHLAIKMPETAEEKAVRKEQHLTDELEEDRGILPSTLRTILLIAGGIMFVVALVVIVIIRFPIGKKTPAPVAVTPPPIVKDEVPAAVREGRIARVLGTAAIPTLRARAEMKNETIVFTRPVGVIPHPYLQSRYAAGYTAVAIREIVDGTTIYTLTANLPDTNENTGYTAFVGYENEPARNLGTMVRGGLGIFSLTMSEAGYMTEPTIYIVGPNPNTPEEQVTILSGTFQLL